MTITTDLATLLVNERAERYRCQLLNENDQLLRDFYEFSGGTYEQNRFADVRGGGSVVALFDGPEALESVRWGSDRLMLWYTPDATRSDQSGIEWPLGVFLIEAPADDYNDDLGTITTSIKIMDKLAVLLQDEVDASYSLPAGTTITDAVRAIILGTGEVKMAITDSDLTLPAGQVWEVGTPKLHIVNDLLAMINYNPLWCDGYGIYRAEPAVMDTERTPVWTFRQGETSIHLPTWSKEQDWFSVPNKVVLVTDGDDEAPGLVAVHENINGNDNLPYRYSQEARGRVITSVQTGVEAADQATLDDMALRSLMSSSQRVTNLTVQHAMVPYWPGDLVAFQTSLYDGTATVSKFSVNMTPGSLVSATWREVERVDR